MARQRFRIKNGDEVVVIAGRKADRGRTGKVLRVLRSEGRVLVEGIHMVKRHRKGSGEQPGAIVESEAPIHISNVALWDSKSERRIKVGMRTEPDGRKVRFDKTTGRAID